MKKIPTLFVREFEGHTVKRVLPEVTEGLEWALEGKGIATIKYDGSCCAIIDGELYKRYDAKHGKPIPEGAIPCQEKADPITGHFPCWLACDRKQPSDKWFYAAYDCLIKDIGIPLDGTYEAIGVHFQGNPYKMEDDRLVRHGLNVAFLKERSFDGIKQFLEENYEEGIVFWKDGEPKCKIKRSDFGLEWGNKRG